MINKNSLLKTNISLIKITLLLLISSLIVCCAPKTMTTIVGGKYNETINETDYFVLPLGSVSLPGKWEKKKYDPRSRQQYFRNKDSVSIAIAFNRFDNYEFNTEGLKKGFDFVKAYYKWESDFFESHGLKSQVLESDFTNNFIIYRIYGQKERGELDTYFLFGEKNGNTSCFSISITDKWDKKDKIAFLKRLYLTKKSK